MSTTKIKICGIKTPEIAQHAALAGANAIGLVFVPKSPRFVTIDQARDITTTLPPFVDPVGLFVNVPPEQITDTARQLNLQTVQLHGDETPDYASSLAPLRIIKALPFNPQTAPDQIAAWSKVPNLAAILFDTPPTPTDQSNNQTGGSGQSFDWSPLAKINTNTPIILAGGLNPTNVAQAIRTTNPYAVDVSSGVESQRGVKDPQLITDFIAAVKGACE